MKTLRFTIVLASLAFCFFTASAFGQTKNENSSVRTQLANLLEFSDISDQGIVDLSFSLVNNHIVVRKIESGKPELDKALTRYLSNRYMKQPSENFSFKVRINLNGALAFNEKMFSQNELRRIISDVFAQSTIKEKGEATILFKINNDKQLEVINVDCENPVLTSKIKDAIDIAAPDLPKDAKGQYAVKVKF